MAIHSNAWKKLTHSHQRSIIRVGKMDSAVFLFRLFPSFSVEIRPNKQFVCTFEDKWGSQLRHLSANVQTAYDFDGKGLNNGRPIVFYNYKIPTFSTQPPEIHF
jgi:hypothetical protein